MSYLPFLGLKAWFEKRGVAQLRRMLLFYPIDLQRQRGARKGRGFSRSYAIILAAPMRLPLRLNKQINKQKLALPSLRLLGMLTYGANQLGGIGPVFLKKRHLFNMRNT